ncbi:acyltransferase family protein [Castellaniella ginsengisoli]
MMRAVDHAKYRLDIQGLRALAVLAVMLFHYDPALLPGGYVGVDIFLVISGFLITQQLFLKKQAADYAATVCLRRFYVSRLRRIVPAYFFMLLLVWGVAKLLFTDDDYAYFLASLKSTAIFTSNQYFAHFGNYFAPGLAEQPLLHTWSLAVEMQFYLLLPALVLMLSGTWVKRVIPILILVLVLVAEWQLRLGGHRQETYYALYSRIPEFLVGSWLAINVVGRDWSQRCADGAILVGLVLIASSLFGLNSASSFPGLLSLPPVIGAALIIAASRSRLSVALAHPVMVWIGFLSYSLYLWHWPILACIRYYTGSQSLGLQATLVFGFGTLLLACLSFYLVEEPARKLRLNVLRPYLTVSSTLAGALLAGVGLLGLYQVAPAAKAYIASAGLGSEYTRYADPADLICHGSDTGHCVKGDLTSELEVLVIGDSHAAMLNDFFAELGKEQHFKARVLTASSCIPIPDFNISKLPEWSQAQCLNQIRRVQTELERDRSRVLVLAGMWSYQLQDSGFAANLEAFLKAHRPDRIYVLSQVPLWLKNPMRIQRFASLGLTSRIPVDPAYRRANDEISRLVKSSGAHFLALDQLPVFSQAPWLAENLLYMDESHLNQVGVRAYAQAAQMQIRTLVSHDAQ